MVVCHTLIVEHGAVEAGGAPAFQARHVLIGAANLTPLFSSLRMVCHTLIVEHGAVEAGRAPAFQARPGQTDPTP